MLEAVAPAPVAAAPAAPGRRPLGAWRDVVAAAVAARFVVLLALGLVAFVRHAVEMRQHVLLRADTLLGWDATWYLRIARHGYAGTPAEGIRFFPAYPLMVRALAPLLAGSFAAAALVLANVGAVGYGLLVHRVARLEGLAPEAARRAVWVAAFTPAAFVLVMGYSEAIYGCALVGCLVAVRTRHWMTAAALGFLAGATRPTGVVIAVFVLVEAARGLPRVSVREAVARLVAVLAPAAGLLSYLAWAGARFGDPLLPFRIQTRTGLRGGVLVEPFGEVAHVVAAAADGSRIGPSLHLPWIVVALALLVVAARRLPASYTAFASVSLLLAVTAGAFSSFERYAGSCVPLVLAAASLQLNRLQRTVAIVIGVAALFGFSVLAFFHLYVP